MSFAASSAFIPISSLFSIPVSEIEQKVKEIEKQNEIETRKKISSPYTRKKVQKAKFVPFTGGKHLSSF